MKRWECEAHDVNISLNKPYASYFWPMHEENVEKSDFESGSICAPLAKDPPQFGSILKAGDIVE
jgi:hypothetical protein